MSMNKHAFESAHGMKNAYRRYKLQRSRTAGASVHSLLTLCLMPIYIMSVKFAWRFMSERFGIKMSVVLVLRG